MPIISKIKVGVRVRPLLSAAAETDYSVGISYEDSAEGKIISKRTNESYIYDWAFGSATEQGTVYNQMCKCLIDDLFQGLNATFLVMVKLVAAGASVDITLSFVEVYMEECYDLLCSKETLHTRRRLDLRETSSGEMFLDGLSEHPVYDLESMRKNLSEANKVRSTGSTEMNLQSSRSHAICTVYVRVVTKPTGCNPKTLVSKLHLVDLAGSERLEKTLATGSTRHEGIAINKGLLAVGKVVAALTSMASSSRHVHVPYRESKLTRLLSDSLGGNSQTVLLACISPADANHDETMNTLRFASRASLVKNEAKVNIDTSGVESSMAVKKLREEIDALKLQRDLLSSKLCSSTIAWDRDRENAIIGKSLALRILTRMRAILIKCQEKGVKVALEGADIIDMVSAISSAIDDLSDGAEMESEDTGYPGYVAFDGSPLQELMDEEADRTKLLPYHLQQRRDEINEALPQPSKCLPSNIWQSDLETKSALIAEKNKALKHTEVELSFITASKEELAAEVKNLNSSFAEQKKLCLEVQQRIQETNSTFQKEKAAMKISEDQSKRREEIALQSISKLSNHLADLEKEKRQQLHERKLLLKKQQEIHNTGALSAIEPADLEQSLLSICDQYLKRSLTDKLQLDPSLVLSHNGQSIEVLFKATTSAQMRVRLLEGQIESMREKLLAREMQLQKSTDRHERDHDLQSEINDTIEVEPPQESNILPAVVSDEKLKYKATAGGDQAKSAEELSKLKVKELKAILKDRGLCVSGSKAVLLKRLNCVPTLAESLNNNTAYSLRKRDNNIITTKSEDPTDNKENVAEDDDDTESDISKSPIVA
eukprot:gene28825-37832_t